MTARDSDATPRSPAGAEAEGWQRGARSAIAHLFNHFLLYLHEWKARRRERELRKRFEEIVADTRSSFRCQLYAKNRAAQLKRRRG